MIDLTDFTHIDQASLTTEDYEGTANALREAQLSTHTTQAGAGLMVAGSSRTAVSAWNRDVGNMEAGHGHHAETLTLYNCARQGIRTQDATLYAPWAACLNCALGIQATGVSRVVVLNTLMQKTPDRWLTSVEQGLYYLYDHGVRVDVLDVDEGYFGYTVRMDGEEVSV